MIKSVLLSTDNKSYRKKGGFALKNKIVIEKTMNNKLNFYWISQYGTFYLFTQKFTKGVYDFFKNGRHMQELRAFKRWDSNPRLDKTVEKIPMYIKYVRKNEAA